VHSIREMIDMMTMARDQAIQRAQERGYNVPGAGPGGSPGAAGPGAGGPGPRPGFRVLGAGESPDAPRPGNWRTPPSRPSRGRGMDFDGPGDIGEDIAGAAVAAGLGILGRAIGKRMQKAFDERVIPAMQQSMQQGMQRQQEMQQQMEQVAARYPELRVCDHDQVVFLAGGHASVPLSEIKMPVTMAQADAIVARLRG
jgi:hypothetical protein